MNNTGARFASHQPLPRRRILVQGSFLAMALLASCGGSDDDPYKEAVDRATKKEAEARAAGVASPCADVSQCGLLTFLSPATGCPNVTYQPYSLVSASAAAASAAAQQQVGLAAVALSLAPPSGISCPAFIATPPALTCRANACGP